MPVALQIIVTQTLAFLLVLVSLGHCSPVTNSPSRKSRKLGKGDGRSFIRRLCPSRVKLNCLNVMYSKPCSYNYDCSYVGPHMLCCQTGCSGSSKFMCIPEENSKCPYLQPAYYTGMKKCFAEENCEKREFICCSNIAGEGYCHKPSQLYQL